MAYRPINKVRPPRRGVFFARIKTFANEDELALIGRAYAFSKYGHAKQFRDDGSRYFDHPKMGAWILIHELGVRDWVTIVIMLLHDLHEDQFILTHRCTKDCFGIDAAYGVDAVTKRKKPRRESIKSYFARIRAVGLRAILVKLVDRLHNMRTLGNCPPHKQERVAKQTLRYFIPLCDELRQYLPHDSRVAEYIEAELRRECAKYI